MSYTYDTNNQLAGIQLPGGSTRQTTYDPLLRVTNITAKDNAQSLLMNYQYGYDKADNILSKNTEHGNYGYAYDNLYRLTQASNPAPLTSEAYTYDTVGNRLTASNVNGAWNYNADNQLTGYGNVSLQYDANGSTAKKTEGSQVTQYGYDTSGRLAQVKDGTTSTIIAQYTYDPFGRRIFKEVNGVKTYFLYSDEGLLAEFDASGALQTAYNFAPDGTWGTNPIFMRTASGYFFYHNDHLGTPQKLTAVNGAVVWSAQVQAFGKATIDPSSTVTNNLRFPGQYYDQETGMSQNWFRDYNFTIARYVQADPIGLIGGPSIYNYVNSNSTTWIDPKGLCWGNARAIAHALVGGDVTLNDIGCYPQVTKAITSQQESWKNQVKALGKSTAMALPCNKSKFFSTSRNVPSQSGIFWIRGFTLNQSATCTATKNCCDPSKSCCVAGGSWSYKCGLNASMYDRWEDPSDWDNSHGKDVWDHWMYGTKYFYVNGSWSDNVSDSGLF